MNTFQRHHLFTILEKFEDHQLPLDLFLSGYFRAHKAVGANDRRTICEAIYGMIRWRGLLDHFLPKPATWQTRLSLFDSINPLDFRGKSEIPPHIRVSFPKSLYEIFRAAYGDARCDELCFISNTTAPTTVRVNEIKISRDALFEKWKSLYSISLSPVSPSGIVFHKKINFFGLEEFKEGLFEVQDEGSQLIAALVQPTPGEQILDFCAGSGGKTLAFAPQTKAKGQIFLHDVRPRALLEAKKRLRRAGIQNAQVLPSDDPYKKKLKGKMDWVLIDVPCSGTGTLRRNPDMKWRFDPEQVERLVLEQREIFAEALEFLAPKGRLVYSTCSILPQENEQQIAFFLEHFPVELEKPVFASHPERGGMDGFFGAVFKRK
ncbi:MAG: RsmB/NOP family class I SAM-dependent RNA methyltransferase [Chlamydiales bacterium]|nr:RsmB/NOP family class I SAM-dependent RNA methyltransferase [Chlamydiales bacterium]